MSGKQKLVSPPEGGGTILDEESTKTLISMFKSRDQANINMAQVMLTQCNIKKSIFWIWQLSRSVYVSEMVNLRTKLGRYFRDTSELFYICGLADLRFAEWLIKKNWMTPFIWDQLEKNVVSTIKRQCSNTFYNVEISLKPEFEQYANPVLTETITNEENTCHQ